MKRECVDCKTEFELSSEKSVVAYCKKCRVTRLKDILEMIIPGEDANTCKSLYFDNEQQAIQELQKWEANIRLDLHNTLDTVEPTQYLDLNYKTGSGSVCCISYVGNITQTRTEARLDIIDRIQSGQIKFGALVFKRGPYKDPQKANNFTEPGSKYWFNKHLPYSTTTTTKVIFVDDSSDHVNSVSLLPHITSILLHNNHHNNIVKVLKKYYS